VIIEIPRQWEKANTKVLIKMPNKLGVYLKKKKPAMAIYLRTKFVGESICFCERTNATSTLATTTKRTKMGKS
jgi:hypothetical protein